jgi:hypothetical protein
MNEQLSELGLLGFKDYRIGRIQNVIREIIEISKIK